MTETSTTKTMDTEPGGEQTQYEGAVTENLPTKKQTGQLGDPSEHTTEGLPVSKERGDKTAENIRYGQSISEQGFGGMTTTTSGEAQQSGYGGQEADRREEKPDSAASRAAQGYGSGSGVGA